MILVYEIFAVLKTASRRGQPSPRSAATAQSALHIKERPSRRPAPPRDPEAALRAAGISTAAAPEA